MKQYIVTISTIEEERQLKAAIKVLGLTAKAITKDREITGSNPAVITDSKKSKAPSARGAADKEDAVFGKMIKEGRKTKPVSMDTIMRNLES